MKLPLYEGAQAASGLYNEGNRGLWYDKFCNKWRPKDQNPWGLEVYEEWHDNKKEKVNPKLEWIKDVVDRPSDKVVVENLVARVRMLVTANGGCSKEFRTSGPFVSGMGRSHPVENGFCWHHLLGEPYLPGSSVKGMVLAWVHDWLDSEERGEYADTYRGIFGGPEGRGSMIFLDALPTQQIVLKADIMTPHYTEYYEKGMAPADWYNPTPIPFLAVEDNQPFLFSVMPAHSDGDGVKDVQQAMIWLEAALANIGAGAKTAVGYGRFKRADGAADPA